MMEYPKQNTGLRPITAGYLRCLAFALLGLVFAAFGVGGVLEARAGRNQDLTFDDYGVPAFIVVGALGFFFRLIFWCRVPDAWQARVRLVMTTILALEVVGIVCAVVWFFEAAPPSVMDMTGTAGSTLLIATVCQIATVRWLVLYSRE